MKPSYTRTYRVLIGTLLMYCCSFPTHAIEPDEIYVPSELDEWKAWVLAEHPQIYCSIDGTNGRRLPCAWISELNVQFFNEETTEVSFRMVGEASAPDRVVIPHGDHRPIGVDLNGNPAQVGVNAQSGEPHVFVETGSFVIKGALRPKSVPRSINIPQHAAVVTLSINGVDVAVPKVEDGKLWLQQQQLATRQDDALSLAAYRRLVDDIPQSLETRIRLTVDGADRIESIGKPIPDGFVGVAVQTDLPIQVTEDGEFSVQVSRGEAWITVRAISESIFDEFTAAKTSTHWPTSEIWVVEQVTQHRTVEVEGVPAIDPTLVESPFGSAPTYRVNQEASLRLANERRGDPNPQPSTFSIHRNMWLAFDGSSMVVQDEIAAEIHAETRLSADYDLGQVQVDGKNRLVTYLDGESQSEPGVTLHPGDGKVEAISKLDDRRNLMANGWLLDADQLTVNLHIPPGWKLLWTKGVDRVAYSWLSEWWNLWDIFLCVLIVVVLYRVAGLPVAVIVTIALLLSYQDHTGPAVGWLLLGLLLLLDRQLNSDTAKRINQVVYWTLLIPFAVGSIYVAANNIRQAVYPQLDELLGTRYAGSNFIQRSDFYLPAPQSAPQMSTQELEQEGVEPHSPRDESSIAQDVEELWVSGAFRRLDQSQRRPLDRSAQPTSSAQAGNLAVQTGPGLPTWRWDNAQLQWSGPVGKTQSMSLTFLPPPATRILFVLIALLQLFFLLLFVLAKLWDTNWAPPWLKKLLPLILISAAATSANAQFPDSELLEELEQRLTASPDCIPGCTSLENARLVMTEEDELRLEVTHLAGESVAVPLPRSQPHAALKQVRRKNSTQSLLNLNNDRTYAQLSKGSNAFVMRFDLRGLNDFVIDFPMDAAKLTFDVCCWSVKESADSNAQRVVLNRIVAADDAPTLDPSHYAFGNDITVIRELEFGFEPKVRTVARARNTLREMVTLEIPLLPGETVLSDSISVQDGKAIVVLEPYVSNPNVAWHSALTLRSELSLTAPAHGDWSEIWFAKGSDFWQFDSSGVMPSQTARGSTVFKPRGGETLLLSLTQPVQAPGKTITVNSASLTSTIGSRTTNGFLELSITASVVDDVTLSVPPNAIVEKVAVNGEEQPLGVGSDVDLPIAHGENHYVVSWRNDESLGWFYRTPPVNLSESSRNIHLQAVFPRDRWVLLLGGPAIGSAVLFWGVVLVTVLVALALTLLPNFPLTKLDAVLIAIGATLANIWALLFVALWILAIWWRARSTLEGLPTSTYRVVQIGLAFLAAVGILALFFTVLSALRTPADMFIATSPMSSTGSYGIAGHAQLLSWFADESDMQLPTAWVLSLPFWVYQLTMLAWSLWLVFALIKWVRSTFTALSTPSFWRESLSKQETNEESEQISDETVAEDDQTEVKSDQ